MKSHNAAGHPAVQQGSVKQSLVSANQLLTQSDHICRARTHILVDPSRYPLMSLLAGFKWDVTQLLQSTYHYMICCRRSNRQWAVGEWSPLVSHDMLASLHSQQVDIVWLALTVQTSPRVELWHGLFLTRECQAGEQYICRGSHLLSIFILIMTVA